MGSSGISYTLTGAAEGMHPFEHAAPDTLEEALALLQAHGAEAKVLAGGQSLVPLLNYRLARPRLVVDITGLPLAHVRAEDGWLRVGGLARHHELEELAEIARACPLLPEVARLIGNVRVRSLGTVGGSLAHADPAAELPLAMVALDARLTLASASGRRVVAARDFFTGYLSTVLGPDELLTEIAVPVTRGMGWAVEEFARRAGDFAVVAVAAGVSLDRRGRVDDARVAFAGVADRPIRATAAEDALRGQEPSADRLARAAEIARDSLDPQSDAFVSGAYRRLLAGVLTRRALGRAVSSAGASTAPSEASPRISIAPAKPALEAWRQRETPGRRFVINERAREVDVRRGETLLEMLRDTLGIFDVKEGCGEGVCGACTVLLDGRPVSSCLVLAAAVRGRAIRTVRGLEREGGLHPLQEAFVRHGAVQCGFCTPGMLLTALAFLERHPRASRDEIRGALAGNLCRCTGYAKILDAVQAYTRGRDGDG
jgi:aerobic carbon-monoxide dehydrogenase medium subunit